MELNRINAYVCNRKQPSLEVLNEIARILQVDVKDLIKSVGITAYIKK